MSYWSAHADAGDCVLDEEPVPMPDDFVSHNPIRIMALSFFNDGFKLPDEMEARIEGLIVSTRLPI
jgi:hypothetical protein